MNTLTIPSGALHEPVIAELETLDALELSDLLDLYVQQAAQQVDALAFALDRADAGAVFKLSHSLKGSSSALGATLVAHAARRLGDAATLGDLSCGVELLDALRHAIEVTNEAFRARLSDTR